MQLRHAVVMAEAAIWMMNRRQHSIPGSELFLIWARFGRETHDMECLGGGSHTIRQRFEGECHDRAFEAVDLAFCFS